LAWILHNNFQLNLNPEDFMSIHFYSGMALGLLGAGFAAPAHATGAAANAAADSCGPAFLQIYDFQVGDVFQDEISSTGHGTGFGPTSETLYRKYSVVSKERLANGYRYVMEGLIHRYTKGGPFPASWKHDYMEMGETWTFLDSARHPANGCKDHIVELPPFAGNSAIFFTRVRIAIGDRQAFPLSSDTTRVKILGARPTDNPADNLYLDSTGISPLPVSAIAYSALYAAGLGCVHYDAFSFETGLGSRLQGHARGHDTLGVISPDEAFLPPASARPEGVAAGRKPDGIALSRAAMLFPVPGGSGYRDLRGGKARIP
jgi:hypothetical protein